MKSISPKVLIIGAIGGFYGALLPKAGTEVSVVCRSDYEHVKQHGYVVNNHDLGRLNFMLAQVQRHASEIEDVADYVVLCTKVIPELDRVALIHPLSQLKQQLSLFKMA